MKMANTVRLSAIALLMAGGMGAAVAAPVSTVVTGTGDVVFTETAQASISVTPVSVLEAGEKTNLVVANAVANATAGNIAFRWTPDASIQTNTPLDRRISGKSDAANKLNVTTIATATQSPSYPDWYVANNSSNTLNIEIRTTPTPQIVAADTYTVSLDAAVWME